MTRVQRIWWFGLAAALVVAGAVCAVLIGGGIGQGYKQPFLGRRVGVALAALLIDHADDAPLEDHRHREL